MDVSTSFPSFVSITPPLATEDQKKQEPTNIHWLDPQNWSLHTQVGFALAIVVPPAAISIKAKALVLTTLVALPKILSFYSSTPTCTKNTKTRSPQPRMHVLIPDPERHSEGILSRAFQWFKDNEISQEVLSMYVECPFLWCMEKSSNYCAAKHAYDLTIPNHNAQVADFHATQIRALNTLSQWQSTLPAMIKQHLNSHDQEPRQRFINRCQRNLKKLVQRRSQDLLESLHDLYETLFAISLKPDLQPGLIEKMNLILKQAIFNYLHIGSKNQNAADHATQFIIENWDKIARSCSDPICQGFFTRSYKQLETVVGPSKTELFFTESSHNFCILNSQPCVSPEESLIQEFQWFKENIQCREIEEMTEECPLAWLIDVSSRELQQENVYFLNRMLEYNSRIKEFHEVSIKALTNASKAFSKWESSLPTILRSHSIHYAKEQTPLLAPEEARKQLIITCQRSLTRHTKFLEQMLLSAIKRLYKKLLALREDLHGHHTFLTQKIDHTLKQTVYQYLCISSRNHARLNGVTAHILKEWHSIATACQTPLCSHAFTYLTPIEI